MGLLNKLKNVLFEEEEIEVPENEVKEEKIINTKPKESFKKKEPVKMTFDSDDEDIISDRELFKAEPTFNFPIFDEQEFDSVKKESSVVPPVHENKSEVKSRVHNSSNTMTESTRPRTVTREKPMDVSITRPPKKTREVRLEKDNYREQRENPGKQKFRPSPVISPVYGVLDKNYKKEDIVVKTEEKKVIDVDSVRKKAFGTLEDDIEKTLNTPVKEFYQKKMEEPKVEEELDNLLKSASEEVIPVQMDDTKVEDYTFNIEEEPIMPITNQESEVGGFDRPKKKSVEEQLADETLENDLFELIDSMYETREDGEV